MTPETRDGPSGDLHGRLADAYRRRGQDLFAFAYRLVDGPGVAEDVVHDAFARLLDGRCHIDMRRGDLDTLLFGVVRNVAREHRRRESTAGRLRARKRWEDETSTQMGRRRPRRRRSPSAWRDCSRSHRPGRHAWSGAALLSGLRRYSGQSSRRWYQRRY